MSPTARIEVATVVTLEPGAAFAAFTEEIGSWFRLTPARSGAAVTGISFEPGVGGRLRATRSGDEVGSVFGTVTVWEPGVRLAFDSPDGTEVEVRFEGVAGGTRVTLEHRGLDRLTPADSDSAFRYGPRLMLGWYEAHLSAEVTGPRGVTPFLFYDDMTSMLEWLSRVFGFVERARFVASDGHVGNAEMRVGDTEIWLSGDNPDRGTQGLTLPYRWLGVWVDDVDAMHERIVGAGVDAPPVKDQNYGVRSFNVTDPEGYTWGFLRRIDNQIGTVITA